MRTVDDVVLLGVAFFLVVAVLGLAVRAFDHPSTWPESYERPAVTAGR